jgi:hypothetical protein
MAYKNFLEPNRAADAAVEAAGKHNRGVRGDYKRGTGNSITNMTGGGGLQADRIEARLPAVDQPV